ncbi:MAG: hypothetical protein R3264_09045, partial [Anaerolineae bacterium]|nr:hypothetical protein [Anaerolineae bacterium]
LTLGLTIGLAAFFWLPAMFEQTFVQIERVITPPDFDYRGHFVTLPDLFSWPPPANTGLLNPEFPLTLGLVQVGLALMLLVPTLRVGTAVGSRVRGTAVFALISLLALIFMMLPSAEPIWDRLPLIAFVQHPSRLQGLTSLLLAILAGLGVSMLPDRIRLWATAGSVGLIFISAVPLLYPRYYPSLPAPATLSGMMAYEQSIGAIGTTSFGEYLPIWVRQTPRESPLLPMYQRQAPIERLEAAYLPAGATVEQADYGLNHAEIVLTAPEPHQVIFNTFYFPGWQARVDGQPVPVAPVTERGLIGVTLPAGPHRLSLFFTETPVRRLANTISLLSLLGLIALTLAWNRIFDPLPCLPSTVYRLPSTHGLMLTLLGLALILGKMLYFDTVHNPLKQDFAATGITGASESRHINFGNQLNFLGYDLPQTEIAAGQSFALTGYWQARQPLNTDYSVLAQLVDENHHLYAGQDNLHPGSRPTSLWEPWGFVKDPHSVTVPPGTPPGDYFLITGPYDPANWNRLPVLPQPASPWADVAAIPVRVERPDRPPSLQALAITWPPSPQAKAAFSQIEEITYLGASPEQAALVRNDFFRLALFWEAVTSPSQNYGIHLRLLDQTDEPVLEQVSQPSHNRYPTSRWSPGERVRDNHALWIAPDVPAGRYRLQLRLLAEDETPLTEWIEVGQVN